MMANLRLSKGNSKEIFEKKGGAQPPYYQTNIAHFSTMRAEAAAGGATPSCKFW